MTVVLPYLLSFAASAAGFLKAVVWGMAICIGFETAKTFVTTPAQNWLHKRAMIKLARSDPETYDDAMRAGITLKFPRPSGPSTTPITGTVNEFRPA